MACRNVIQLRIAAPDVMRCRASERVYTNGRIGGKNSRVESGEDNAEEVQASHVHCEIMISITT